MSTREVKTQWDEVSLDLILREFVKGYTFNDGSTLIDHDVFIDMSKRKVVFKLVTSKET